MNHSFIASFFLVTGASLAGCQMRHAVARTVSNVAVDVVDQVAKAERQTPQATTRDHSEPRATRDNTPATSNSAFLLNLDEWPLDRVEAALAVTNRRRNELANKEQSGQMSAADFHSSYLLETRSYLLGCIRGAVLRRQQMIAEVSASEKSLEELSKFGTDVQVKKAQERLDEAKRMVKVRSVLGMDWFRAGGEPPPENASTHYLSETDRVQWDKTDIPFRYTIAFADFSQLELNGVDHPRVHGRRECVGYRQKEVAGGSGVFNDVISTLDATSCLAREAQAAYAEQLVSTARPVAGALREYMIEEVEFSKKLMALAERRRTDEIAALLTALRHDVLSRSVLDDPANK
jgi:hypothetical protein